MVEVISSLNFKFGRLGWVGFGLGEDHSYLVRSHTKLAPSVAPEGTVATITHDRVQRDLSSVESQVGVRDESHNRTGREKVLYLRLQ